MKYVITSYTQGIEVIDGDDDDVTEYILDFLDWEHQDEDFKVKKIESEATEEWEEESITYNSLEWIDTHESKFFNNDWW